MKTLNPVQFDRFFSVLAVGTVSLCTAFLPHSLIRRAYFYPPEKYFWVVLAFGMITLLNTFRNRTKPESFNVPLCSLVIIFSCFLMDVAYGLFQVTIPVNHSSEVWKACTTDINAYLIDRSYHYIAIFFLILFIAARTGKPVLFLKWGSVSAKSDILGRAQPVPWSTILLKISLLFLGGSLTLMWLRWDPVKARILPAQIPGGINNSVLEELIFRALYLSMFCSFMGRNRANHLQAIFFSYIHLHWDLIAGTAGLGLLGVKFVLYYLLGWFFGRMTFETEGVLASCILHSVITVGIWLSLPVF